MDLAMAQRLVDRRKAAGLSQEALAAQLGVSRQAVSKWERSESSPDTDNLIALAALYGVSLDKLLYGEATNDADGPEDGSADTETADVADEAEDSAERADCGDKPLVDISLARGIHVIDPNKGEEVHVGWSGIHVTNERKGEEVHVGPGGVHIDTLEDDGPSMAPPSSPPEPTAPSPSTARRFPAGRKHTTSSTIMASISTPRSDVHGTNSPSPHLSLSPIWCSALSTAHGAWGFSSSFWFPSTTRLVTLSIDAICQSSLNASIQQPPSLGSSTCGSVWDSPILHGSSSSRFPS